MQAHLLTKQDVAEYLRVSKRFVEIQVSSKALSAVKLGRAVRFRFEDLVEFVEARRLHSIQSPLKYSHHPSKSFADEIRAERATGGARIQSPFEEADPNETRN